MVHMNEKWSTYYYVESFAVPAVVEEFTAEWLLLSFTAFLLLVSKLLLLSASSLSENSLTVSDELLASSIYKLSDIQK